DGHAGGGRAAHVLPLLRPAGTPRGLAMLDGAPERPRLRAGGSLLRGRGDGQWDMGAQTQERRRPSSMLKIWRRQLAAMLQNDDRTWLSFVCSALAREHPRSPLFSLDSAARIDKARDWCARARANGLH